MKRYDCMKALAARLKRRARDPVARGKRRRVVQRRAAHARASLFQQQLGCVTPRGVWARLRVAAPAHRFARHRRRDAVQPRNSCHARQRAAEEPVRRRLGQRMLPVDRRPADAHRIGRVDLAAIARGAGVEQAFTARTLEEFEAHCAEGLASDVPYLLVAKVDRPCSPASSASTATVAKTNTSSFGTSK